MKSIFTICVLVAFCACLLSCNTKKPSKQEKKLLAEKEVQLNKASKALLNVISGKAGEKRDWNKFRSMFVKTATLSGVEFKNDSVSIKEMTVEDYIFIADKAFQTMSFHEIEISKKVNIFGNIAQILQVYVSTSTGEKTSSERGVNFIQLIYNGKDWKITNIVWQAESNELRIPSIWLETDKRQILPS